MVNVIRSMPSSAALNTTLEKMENAKLYRPMAIIMREFGKAIWRSDILQQNFTSSGLFEMNGWLEPVVDEVQYHQIYRD